VQKYEKWQNGNNDWNYSPKKKTHSWYPVQSINCDFSFQHVNYLIAYIQLNNIFFSIFMEECRKTAFYNYKVEN